MDARRLGEPVAPPRVEGVSVMVLAAKRKGQIDRSTGVIRWLGGVCPGRERLEMRRQLSSECGAGGRSTGSGRAPSGRVSGAARNNGS